MTVSSNALLEAEPPTSRPRGLFARLRSPVVRSPVVSSPFASSPFAEIGDLFRQYAAFVARSLRQLGVAERDVEDGVQEVFLVAARKRGSIVAGAEKSFLYGTAMRVAQNAKRGVKRLRWSGEPVEDEQIDLHPGPTAEELVDQRQARAALDAVLEGMSVEMRAVFTLYTLEEMTTNEIAALLGIPAGTVSSRLKRGREHFDEQVRLLQMRLDRRGGQR